MTLLNRYAIGGLPASLDGYKLASGWRNLLIAARSTKLTNDPIESSRHALRSSNLVILLCRVPIKLERPSFRAVLEQAAQRETHLDPVDPHVGGTADARPQDMDG